MSLPTSSLSKKITLRSSDDEIFEVDEEVLLECQTIKHMIDDGCANSIIPLPNVTGRIMVKVIEYCKRHLEVAEDKDEIFPIDGHQALKDWDTEFVKEVKKDHTVLFGLIMAANYLDMKNLMDLLCKSVANFN
ncbi:SKP1-like protein 3 [Manihot esculenta]|uniref:SKP1-like protein n=1 Tax=Manihot esculenta TaxID=3983 RepID=A0A2C9W3G6_MANES|nr:SKP1-like protein 3 [Manihot esculenta]OAY53009.1 hypothetical protein MANES_04G129000v8 [Manihot esculenta]